jgi:predicted transposase/invertase (TIGR01784 family)
LEKEIDDWLHVMKYDEVPEHYHSPYMKQVADKLSILKMTPQERASYSHYQKKLYTDRDEIQSATNKGREEGRVEVAKNLLKAGLDLQLISDSTGLSIDEINKLSNK